MHVVVVCVDGVVEAQLQLREQTIYHLKQEMASLRENTDSTIFMLEERIKEQMSEIEELRCQLGNQKGDINIIVSWLFL